MSMGPSDCKQWGSNTWISSNTDRRMLSSNGDDKVHQTLRSGLLFKEVLPCSVRARFVLVIVVTS